MGGVYAHVYIWVCLSMVLNCVLSSGITGMWYHPDLEKFTFVFVTTKLPNSWKLNNSLLNEKWVKTEINDFLELNKNELRTYSNFRP